MTIVHQQNRNAIDAAPWACRAPDLAAWAMANLVNRLDRWGAYLPLDNRTGNCTAITASGTLTADIITKHFTGRDVGDLIGLHSTSPDETCRWCAWDFDAHGNFDAAIRDANEDAATSLFYRLEDRGFRPILEDSNGRGGFHVWLIFNRPATVGAIHAFAKALTDGLGDVETFPKQDRLTGKGLGNWLRLPGRHHTLDHWSRIYDRNGGWLDREEAINEILA
jgi:putative DNA primase/helicase